LRIKHQSVIAVTVLIVVLTAASTYLRADTGTCGGASITLPFTDVPSTNIFFCSIAEAYFSALTNGTTAMTYSPSANVPREQMAAFITRTLDQSLKRGSRRAALNQFWTATAHFDVGLGVTQLPGVGPLRLVQSDGADLWIASFGDNTVLRVRASDGRFLETWPGATNAFGVLVAEGIVFVTGRTNPNGSLYAIDPTQSPVLVTTLTSSLGSNPTGIAFDGDKIWTATSSTGPGAGSVSIFSLVTFTPTTVSTGFSQPIGIVFDGVNIWVSDTGDDTLKKLNSGGGVIQAVDVGRSPQFPAFDGTNIWVPNLISNTVTVVRAAGPLGGTVLATLTGNGLNSPRSVAFDGERILVMNEGGSRNLSLWRASDLTQIGFTSAGSSAGSSIIPFGVCSDGLNFWITLSGSRLSRF
jgi:hypothetical protein